MSNYLPSLGTLGFWNIYIHIGCVVLPWHLEFYILKCKFFISIFSMNKAILSKKKFYISKCKIFYILKQQTLINFLVPTTKLIKIKNHPLYPKCVSLFFVGPIFCNLASLGDNFQKLNIINFLYWFWTFKMMDHHRKFNFQNYLSKYFSKNWFCILAQISPDWLWIFSCTHLFILHISLSEVFLWRF